jgi:hypothetical protein
MKSVILSTILTLAVSVTAQDYNQSKPFNLIVVSSNKTINGASLIACHEGAAIEGLCISTMPSLKGATASTYQFNTSDFESVGNARAGKTGILTYELRGGNFNESEPLSLSYSPTSNVAVPLFSPGYESQEVAFDQSGHLNIQGYIDDTTDPATIGGSTGTATKPYYNWYVCTTYAGYTYQTLAWVVGRNKPQNPTCVKVDVKRVFV